MSLSIYDEKITRLNTRDGVNITLTNSSSLLNVTLLQDGLYKITPLFYYDTVTVSNGILETGKGYFITDQTSYNFTSIKPLFLQDTVVLTTASVTGYALLWLTDNYANPYINARVEVYGSNDNETYELLEIVRTDHNGQVTYSVTDYDYIKFKYMEECSDAIEL